MFTGTLIVDLFAAVERAENSARWSQLQNTNSGSSTRPEDVCHCKNGSESEQLAQSFGLSPADRNLSLLFVVHPQLVGALEPWDDFADAVDVHQVGAVGPPKKIRV